MQQGGFTLIELSMVLVIIGLIVGGVFVGQELVRASEVRKTVSQFQRFNTAVNTFKGKYSCLPGDCSNATNFGFTDQAGGYSWPNGNGNGSIEIPNGEGRNFWWHLRQANLLSDPVDYPTDPMNTWSHAGQPGSQSPFTPINQRRSQTYFHPEMIGGWWLYYFDSSYVNSYVNFGGHVFIINTCANSGCSEAEIIKPIDSYALDSKIDDGFPTTGTMRATSQGGYGNGAASAGATGSANCMDNSNTPTVYNVKNGAYACSAIMQAQF